jgi:hypothetical protein
VFCPGVWAATMIGSGRHMLLHAIHGRDHLASHSRFFPASLHVPFWRTGYSPLPRIGYDQSVERTCKNGCPGLLYGPTYFSCENWRGAQKRSTSARLADVLEEQAPKRRSTVLAHLALAATCDPIRSIFLTPRACTILKACRRSVDISLSRRRRQF